MSFFANFQSKVFRIARRTARKVLRRRSGFGGVQPIGHVLDLTKPDARLVQRLKGRTEILALQAWSEGRYAHPTFTYHVAHEPPQPGVVFVSVCNDKYAPGLEALIVSLLAQYPGMNNRYVVYHDGGLSPFIQARLRSIYPAFEFECRDPAKYNVVLGDEPNHKRVGLLGYLSVEALEFVGVDRVVILDTDLLALGDISPLWTGSPTVKAVPDIGVFPYGIVSAKSGRPVINSGVLSLPGSILGSNGVQRRDAVLSALASYNDKDIERFADQRFWNVFLADLEVELLPQNFNCVKSLVTSSFPHELANVAILHCTGAKPWYGIVNEDLISSEERDAFRRAKSRFSVSFALWERTYRAGLLPIRLGRYRSDVGATLAALQGGLEGRPVVLIGNGPSIGKTDLSAFAEYEKVVFNWFVHHEAWDSVKPDHLVIASHMLFGGWNTPRPELPPEYLIALTRHQHKPRLWISYYFKEYVETIPELRDYPISYFFFEKPFKRRVAQTARIEFDLTKPLTDSNTGVLTVGVPLAVHRGAKRIVLVGCDSNYASTQGSYFYPVEQHRSKTTREDTLLKTWARGGEGAYGYRIAARQLKERDIEFFDATIDGSLDMLPKISLDQARALAAEA